MSGAGFLVNQESWTTEAVCKTEHADSKLFILEKGYSAREAQKYCRRCPVRSECLQYAIRTGSVGVWGGHVFTFKTDILEIKPIINVKDFRTTPVLDNERKRNPSLLGVKPIVEVKKIPSIFGNQNS